MGHYGRVIMVEQYEINGPGKYTVLRHSTGLHARARTSLSWDLS